MTSPQQLEVLDLRHFSGKQLRPLLNQQAAAWKQRLRWDYRAATDLLVDYLDSRILPGFVALHRGRICGYTFCVYEGQKAVIGDLFAGAENAAPLAVTHTLGRHLLEVLEASPDLSRLEAQLLLFDTGVLAQALAPTHFQVFPRLFLERDLTALPPPPPRALPRPLEAERWLAVRYNPAAELILNAYRGHIDAEINDQYRTLEGSLRFLHNVIRFPGCGNFDPDASWIVRDRTSNALLALLLVSRVAPEVAHVTQLCVAPDRQGERLGEHLLLLAMARLPALGYRSLSLTVTENNPAALHLYRAAGFRTRHRFDALVLDQPGGLPRLHLVPR